MESEHRVTYKVYYEDTDSLGVVYYANYLKFLERGRSELLGSQGRPIHEWNRDGYYFVVFELSMKFKRPECRGELLVEAEVDVVCVDAQQQLREFPAL